MTHSFAEPKVARVRGPALQASQVPGPRIATRDEFGFDLGAWEIFQQPQFLEIYARHFGWSVMTLRGVNIFARRAPGLGLIRVQIYGPEAAAGAEWHRLLRDLPAGRIDAVTNAPLPLAVARPVSPADLHSFVIDLRQGPDSLLASFDSGLRKALRRAEREGMTVRGTTRGHDLVAFYQVALRATRGGTLYELADLALLHAILEAGFARLYVLEHRGRVVGGLFNLVNRYAQGYLSCFDREACPGLPGNVLYWGAMKGEIEAGTPFLDLGAQRLEAAGLTRAKSAYSPRLVPAYHYELSGSRWRGALVDGWRWLKRLNLQGPPAPTKATAQPG